MEPSEPEEYDEDGGMKKSHRDHEQKRNLQRDPAWYQPFHCVFTLGAKTYPIDRTVWMRSGVRTSRSIF